jgi:parvulin-like peptidyl-prolyl isomerase
MKAENAKGLAHPILGRYYGFTTTGTTVAEFEKIINSLKPIQP